MSVNVHVYPLAIDAINNGTIKLTSDSFKALLCTGAATTWGTTQYAYQYVTDVTGAYTEVTGGGYARVALAGLSLARATDVITWSCTSPISFGSDVTITAASMFIYDNTVDPGVDAGSPVVCVIDFGASESSNAGIFEYTCSSGLATWTEN